MKASPSSEKRREIVFERVEETGRFNPNSLRSIICKIINYRHSGIIKNAAAYMKKHGGRYLSYKSSSSDAQKLYVSMNTKALTKIINDEIHIEYWHIESISNSIGIPAGILLILSRLESIKTRNMQISEDRLIDDLDAFVKFARANSEKSQIDEAYLRGAAECFSSFKESSEYVGDIFGQNRI